jgi:hypothetical protein
MYTNCFSNRHFYPYKLTMWLTVLKYPSLSLWVYKYAYTPHGPCTPCQCLTLRQPENSLKLCYICRTPTWSRISRGYVGSSNIYIPPVSYLQQSLQPYTIVSHSTPTAQERTIKNNGIQLHTIENQPIRTNREQGAEHIQNTTETPILAPYKPPKHFGRYRVTKRQTPYLFSICSHSVLITVTYKQHLGIKRRCSYSVLIKY